MNLIVAVDSNWGIGKNNGLLFRLKKDMQFFKETTTGKVIIVGANTFKSFPKGALPNRTNIVLDDKRQTYQNALTVGNLDELDAIIAEYDADDVYVCGGASVYKTLLPRCKTAYVTKVKADGQADAFFPNLDKDGRFSLVSQSQDVSDGEYIINFCVYVNNAI